jgi:ribosomal protein S3
MGQKVHPIGFRLGVSKDWASKWYAEGKDYANFLEKDFEVREFIRKKLAHASVSQIQIERPRNGAQITIFTARPGIVIGRKGEDIEVLKREISAIMGVPTSVNIEEIRRPELDAYLVADGIAKQLERRVMFRRAMKRSVASTMRLGAAGIKVSIAGRLNGAEIARTEWYREGRVPLHTLRADIDYGFAEAHTTYGVIGVKVWIFKGENLEGLDNSANTTVGEVPEEKRARRNNKPRTQRRKD